MTEYISDICPFCGTEKVLFDEYYQLPKCFDFLFICPKHPAQLFFDIPMEDFAIITYD